MAGTSQRPAPYPANRSHNPRTMPTPPRRSLNNESNGELFSVPPQKSTRRRPYHYEPRSEPPRMAPLSKLFAPSSTELDQRTSSGHFHSDLSADEVSEPVAKRPRIAEEHIRTAKAAQASLYEYFESLLKGSEDTRKKLDEKEVESKKDKASIAELQSKNADLELRQTELGRRVEQLERELVDESERNRDRDVIKQRFNAIKKHWTSMGKLMGDDHDVGMDEEDDIKRQSN